MITAPDGVTTKLVDLDGLSPFDLERCDPAEVARASATLLLEVLRTPAAALAGSQT